MAVVFQFKEIKPKTLDIDGIVDALVKAAEQAADDIEKDFQYTVMTWNHQPKFEKLVSVDSDGIAVIVGTDDEIYGYVNDGTKDHYVAPVHAKALRFRPIYVAKTSPGSMVAKRGGSSGDYVYSRGHMVSGIKARKFDKRIEKEWNKKYKRRMEKAMRDAKNASNWSVD